MSQYTTLDELILATLKYGPWGFSELQSGALWAECRSITSAAGTSRAPFGLSPANVLARRLQALRKAGKIRHTGTRAGEGWKLIERERQ